MKEIRKTWNTKSGKNVEVTGKLITEKEIKVFEQKETVPTCEIYMNVFVEGKGNQGDWVKELPTATRKANPGYTHVVGQYALTAEQAEIIESVREELEATKEWQAKLSHDAAIEAADEKYYADYRKTERAMNV